MTCPLWSTTKTVRPRTLLRFEALEDAVERNHGGEHSAELVAHLRGTAITKAGGCPGLSASGSLRNTTDCAQAEKARCRFFADEGVLIGAKLPAPAPLASLLTAVR
jgi:hypothetical protein